MANRNRNAGHGWELTNVKRLKEIGFENVATSRACSRLRDSKKVDICNQDEDEFGRLPYNIQCKNLSKNVNYVQLLNELEEHNGRKQTNVIFLKQTKKTEGGKNFLPVGEYAILNLDDFIDIMKQLRVGEDVLDMISDIVKENCTEDEMELLNFRIKEAGGVEI